MKHCPACTTPLASDTAVRCGTCGISFATRPAIDSADLGARVRSRHRRLTAVTFLITGTIAAAIPCLLYGSTLTHWILSLLMAGASTAIIYAKVSGSTLPMLLYALPQIVACGVNFFAWLCYLIIGMILGLWKTSLRDVT